MSADTHVEHDGPTPMPPEPPAPGELGGHGPCEHTVLEAKNGGWPDQTVWVIEPTGDCAPRTGGRGDDGRRPVVFMTSGWSVFEQTSPAAYKALIENLVSNGYIVVFANYNGDGGQFFETCEEPEVYDQVDAAFVQATGMTDRMDLSDVGLWGHSFGGGMIPWLAQRAAGRGWGSDTLWLGIYSPYYPRRVGKDPSPIELPHHTRALVVAYEDDVFAQIVDVASPQIFHRLDIPAEHKHHVTISSDRRGESDDDELSVMTSHFTPAGWPRETHLNHYGSHRLVQAVSEAARAGRVCDVDLSYMGTWSDGRPAARSVVTRSPVAAPVSS